MWPNMDTSRSENGSMWPAVAQCLWLLAPPLAPPDLVSNANGRCRIPNQPQPGPNQLPFAVSRQDTDDLSPGKTANGNSRCSDERTRTPPPRNWSGSH